MKTYNLSDDKIKQIARLCVQEQGTIKGVRAEVSLMANLLETNSAYRKKYGEDLYSFVRYGKWFSRAAHWMDNGSASSAAVAAVRDVLVNGNRFFPGNFVDEHDCLSDISEVRTDGKLIDKRDRTAYTRDKTVIKNVYGSTYTFWCFPDAHSDPFGYTDSKRRWAAELVDDYVLVEVM